MILQNLKKKKSNINGVSIHNSTYDTKQFVIAGPKRVEKYCIGFKASLFCVKWTIHKHMGKFCWS